MKISRFVLLMLAALFIIPVAAARAETAQLETPARYAFLLDVNTGTVLLEKNADELMSPASMSKLMTMVMVFEALKNGDLSLSDKFFISEEAWRRGGAKSGSSTMFAKLNSNIELKDLIPAVIVQSANDACIAIAEGMSGSEAEFARAMTRKARELGLEKSIFANATGWPDPGQKMTARELAKLAAHIIRTYPEYYPVFSQRKFTWNGITQSNRNPLLYQDIGADGLKTGHTQDSGYGLVASAVRNGRRLILVLNGLKSKKVRASEGRRLIDWGFRNFRPVKLAGAGKVLGKAHVWGGTSDTVDLVPGKDVFMLMPRTSRNAVRLSIRYTSPLKAPVAKNAPVATLVGSAPGARPLEMPLYAATSVARAGIFARGWGVVKSWLPF